MTFGPPDRAARCAAISAAGLQPAIMELIGESAMAVLETHLQLEPSIWMTMAWWSRRSSSAVATTGLPKISKKP